MSIATVDQATFNKFLNDAIRRYMRQGLSRSHAIREAHWVLGSCFQVDDPRADQRDVDEEREGSMR